jgi:hypothetical protein
MRLRKKYVVGALGDGLVRIGRKHGEKFGTFLGCKRSTAGANRQLSFRPRVPRANFLAEFCVNGVLPRRTLDLDV